MNKQPFQRVISPPKSELAELTSSLTPGEREVVEFFDRNLPIAWEIYIQPYLNGLRPDIVLLHPRVGIAVFEIKDWNLNAMRYEVISNKDDHPKLWATHYKTGKSFSMEKDNPIRKAKIYKDEVINLYCPRLNACFAQALVTAGVIMTRASQAQVDDLFRPFTENNKYPQYSPVVGMEAILSDDVKTVFPESQRHYSSYMNEELAADLRHWLTEPDFSKEQRIPLIFNQAQKRLATTRTQSGYRRIKGAAGSGKSMIIAARAAELAAQGKSVLVISFNITLLHYLRSLAYRYQDTSRHSKKSIVYLNFHYWCKRICTENDYEYEYKALWLGRAKNQDKSEEILKTVLPQLVKTIITAEKARDAIELYDAVLVDEGQDFHILWWQTLRQIVKPKGEMLLVHDNTQDIYGSAQDWTEQAMSSCGFKGQWVELAGSYRLPEPLLPLVRNFVSRYLPDNSNLPTLPVQGSLDFHKCRLKWRQVSPHKARETCLNELFNILTQADQDSDLSMSDMVFLSSGQDFGYQIVCELGQNGIKVAHTFSRNTTDSRRKKVYFFMSSPTIKVTTLHSFKGWEARAIVIYIDEYIDKSFFPLIYVGLTRLKCHVKWSYLTVVCASDRLREFGQTWADYQEIN